MLTPPFGSNHRQQTRGVPLSHLYSTFMRRQATQLEPNFNNIIELAPESQNSHIGLVSNYPPAKVANSNLVWSSEVFHEDCTA